MAVQLRICMIVGIGLYFVFVVYFLRKKKLLLKYTLLWLLSGLFLGILVLIPDFLYAIVDMIGIQTPVNGLFIILIFFMLTIMISLTSIISKQSDKIRNLCQKMAIMETKIRKLEQRSEETENSN